MIFLKNIFLNLRFVRGNYIFVLISKLIFLVIDYDLEAYFWVRTFYLHTSLTVHT